MSVVVFTGPTLTAEEGRRLLPTAAFHGPGGSGDVYRAWRDGATTIGIIDGTFDHRQAVLHKEILWALSRGARVYGAGSMGALRAAELAPFGMVGVGRIFTLYRDGVLTDDDEVAVIHDAAERGFLARSQALVDIRETLARAAAAEIVAPAVASTLAALGKGLFYPRRTWPAILELARQASIPRDQVERLEEWLEQPGHRVDQKRRDALDMLLAIREGLGQPFTPPRFHFEHTEAWHEQRRRFDAPPGAEERRAAPPVTVEQLLEEVQLAGTRFFETVWRIALNRALTLAVARSRDIPPEDLQAALAAFREQRGLHTPEELTAWSSRQGLDASELARLVGEEAAIEEAREDARSAVLAQIPDALRTLDQWHEMITRARSKQATPVDQAVVAADHLVADYFKHRLKEDVPSDLAGYVRRIGFASEDDFLLALIRDRSSWGGPTGKT